MTLADRRPLTNAYEPPLPAVRRWSICGAGLGFGPQSSQTGSESPLSGEAAIHRYFEELVKQPPMKNFKAKAIEGGMTGPDAGFAAGAFGGDVQNPATGASSHAMGTFLCDVVREGAGWKFRSDAWSVLPPAQPNKEAAYQ